MKPGAEPSRNRERIRGCVLVGVLTVFLPAMLLFAGPGSAAAPHWSVQTTPSLHAGDVLNAVSCTSPTSCVAVGGRPSGRGRLFTERWNGRAWSLQQLPTPSLSYSYLNAVSCSSSTSCTAVGSSVVGVLVERWNGKKWSIHAAPAPGGTSSELLGVSCPSKMVCFAVGDWTSQNGNGPTDPLLERWNGSKWSIQPTAEPFGSNQQVTLDGISCTSLTACTVVGLAFANIATAVAERWNGTQWTVQNLGVGSGDWGYENHYAVSCASSRSCAAVGQGEADAPSTGSSYWSLAEFWNGERWGGLSTQGGYSFLGDDDLLAVSCASTTSCLAVGTIVQHWNGSRWSIVHSPFHFNGANAPGVLRGVSCSSKDICEVVGSKPNNHGATEPLAARWVS